MEDNGYELVKVIGFLAGTLHRLATGEQLDSNEIQQLQNIADDFGYYELDPTEFRW